MEILILYCVFTYLFMIGMATNRTGKLDFWEIIIVFFMIILSPIIVPIWLGIEFGK